MKSGDECNYLRCIIWFDLIMCNENKIEIYIDLYSVFVPSVLYHSVPSVKSVPSVLYHFVPSVLYHFVPSVVALGTYM